MEDRRGEERGRKSEDGEEEGRGRRRGEEGADVECRVGGREKER